MMTNTSTILISSLFITIAATSAKMTGAADEFSQGRTQLMVTGGNGYAFNDRYFVLGIGGRYFLVDGLSIGLQAETWTGGDPSIHKITPSLQYVFYRVPNVSPYLGAFYRRTYIDNLPDLNSIGGRAGAYFAASSNANIGAGVVYESYQDCSETRYSDCSETYPEISFTFSF